MLHCFKKSIAARSRPAFIVGLVFLLSSAAYSQSTLYLQGAQVFTSSGSLIYVNGSVTYTDGDINHYGTIDVTRDWTNTNMADSVFNDSSTGWVVLTGTVMQHNIDGTPTAFPNLALDTAGNNALLAVNTIVNNTLNLNNNVMDVNGNDLFVRNSSTLAIEKDAADAGYVNTSNRPNGRLVQNVVADTTYTFPLGGGAAFRYRPLIVTPQNNGTIATQFQNYDPDNDGFDRLHTIGNFNDVNPNFYHTIAYVNGDGRFGDVTTSGTADVSIPYSSTYDGGVYSALAQWKFGDHWELANNYHNVTTGTGATDQQMNYTLVDTGTNILALANYIDNNNLYIVNAFSPNGDGKNDYFYIHGLENYKYNEVKVYNRWGQMLMSERNYQNDWQGNNLDLDVYMYTLKVVDEAGIEHFYKGDVTVVK